MSEIILAIGLVLVVEGLVYAAFPEAIKRMMEMALSLPDSSLRYAGIAALAGGVFLVWLVRG